MQEVTGYIEGERNYYNIKGDTGPCVYPAGFLYIFSALKKLLNDGDIRSFQYFFLGVYVLFISVVLLLYWNASETKEHKEQYEEQEEDEEQEEYESYESEDETETTTSISLKDALPYIMIALCLSRRIHSIFVLRLFNDCIAMLFTYISFLAFQWDSWLIGCIIYSLGLSVKMNILLFLPGLLVLLTKRFGFFKMILHAFVILVIQILLGIPFLLEYPEAYIDRAFNFGRKFTYIWTVNWKFLSESFFLNEHFHKVLLILTLFFWILFGFKWTSVDGGPINAILKGASSSMKTHRITSIHILWVLFTSNFVGIVFSRSLHFQFYVWYFHTLPFLLIFTPYTNLVKFATLIGIECVWNIFPSNATSSICLQILHISILFGLLMIPGGNAYEPRQNQSKLKQD